MLKLLFWREKERLWITDGSNFIEIPIHFYTLDVKPNRALLGKSEMRLSADLDISFSRIENALVTEITSDPTENYISGFTQGT